MDRRLRHCGLTLVLLVSASTVFPVAAHGPKTSQQPAAEQVVLKTSPPDVAGEVWGCPMCETVREPRSGTCPICRMDLVRLRPDTGDGVEDGAVMAGAPVSETEEAGEADRPPALMPGVPDRVFYAAAVGVLLLSFVLFELWGRRRLRDRGRGPRWNLMRLPGLEWMLRRPRFVFVAQLPVFLLFSVVVFAGLFGNQAPERNLAPVLTWTLWWTWLAFVILFLGKAWCTVCPWMAVADWIARLGTLRRSRRPFGLEKRWPRRLRNIWLATFLFVLLTWLELGYGVTGKPLLTALLALMMVAASVGTVLVFERKAFCRYACLVGRVSGLYSMFAASELRARDRTICRSCSTKDCFHGNERGSACPTQQFMGGMETNTYCTLCLECVKSCPEKNVSWNARPPGSDLVESSRVRVDEAYLAVIMLSMSAFHGLTMTPAWDGLVQWIEATSGATWLVAFSIGMAAMILLPLGVYYGICVLMKHFAGDRRHSTRFLFIKFSYSLLPIALFYHLAHNLQHVFFEGKKLLRIASDPFGWGWDLFGTADMLIDAVLPVSIGWSIQVALIIIGHVFGIYIAHKAAFALYPNPRRATLSQIPMLAAMLLFSLQSLWLIAQPMVMRTAM